MVQLLAFAESYCLATRMKQYSRLKLHQPTSCIKSADSLLLFSAAKEALTTILIYKFEAVEVFTDLLLQDNTDIEINSFPFIINSIHYSVVC